MTRQPYELEHPLYPHKDLLAHYDSHKLKYQPQQGTYDDTYRNWYQLVRADHDLSGAPKRPIYREVTQIIRMRSANQEYLLYSEYLIGFDHNNEPQPFFHTYGLYQKPLFRTTYNYDTKTSHVIPTGQIQTVYFIKYDPQFIDKLYQSGPDDMDIELLINVGGKQYGGRSFFTQHEFRDGQFEELAKKGAKGKEMFTQPTIPVPYSTAVTELKAMGIKDPNEQERLYHEFIAYTKWKNSQAQTMDKISVFKELEKAEAVPKKEVEETTTTRTVKIKGPGDK